MQRLQGRLVAEFLSCLVVVACAGSPTAPSDDVVAAGGEANVRFGQRVRVGELAITFTEVVGESRCPTNVQCVWAGDAEIRLALERGSQKTEATVHTHGGTNFPKTVRFDRYEITLVDLTPYPGEQRPAPSSYTARLQITSL